MTEWKDIPGYNGKYQISVDGEVRHVWPSGKVTLLHPFRYGAQGGKAEKSRRSTLYVKLRKDGVDHVHKVFRLMADTFLGGIPDGLVAYHKDGHPQNDYLRNIGFITPQQLGSLTGRKSHRRCVMKLDQDGEVVDIFPSAREAARQEHMSYQAVIDRCLGRIKKPYALNGYTYVYEELRKEWSHEPL